MSVTEIKLKETERLIGQGLDAENMLKSLEIIGINGYSEEEIKSFRLWGDYLPMGSECPYSEEERNMHILYHIFQTFHQIGNRAGNGTICQSSPRAFHLYSLSPKSIISVL